MYGGKECKEEEEGRGGRERVLSVEAGTEQNTENYKHDEVVPSVEAGTEQKTEDCKHHAPSSEVGAKNPAAMGESLESQIPKSACKSRQKGGNVLILHPIFSGSHERVQENSVQCGNVKEGETEVANGGEAGVKQQVEDCKHDEVIPSVEAGTEQNTENYKHDEVVPSVEAGTEQNTENYKHDEVVQSVEAGTEQKTEDCKHHAPSSEVGAKNPAMGESSESQIPKSACKSRQKGGNVLILHPIFSGSHERVVRGVGEVLAKRGHQVTQIRWRSSLTQEVNSSVKIITLSPDNSDLRYPYMDRNGTFHPPITMLWERPRRTWQKLLGDTALLKELKEGRYSVAVVDLIANECSLALAYRLGLPVVGYWGYNYQGSQPGHMGMLQSPGVVPAFMSELGASMTFPDRVFNALVVLVESIFSAYQLYVTDYYIKKLEPEVPDSRQLLSQVDAVVVNSHWLVDYPKLLPPHVQYLGCATCGPPSPLPPNLESWMREAEEGVVVFALGLTGFDASAVPTHIIHSFLSAFSHLKQQVLFKFDPAFLDHVPHNVLVLDWIPQRDILGSSSVGEAVYYGVPMVVMPIFADQGDNSRRIVDRGLGVQVDKTEITQHNVLAALNTILGDDKYRQTAKKFSRLCQKEELGKEVAANWVEKVMHFGHLKYLRPPGTDLSFIQYFAIDAYLFLLALALTPSIFLWFFCCRKFSSQTKTEQTTAKQKVH
ncbi:hypothetical protein Pcinc_027723 [Petrolisthes cinctipes]|uniref:Uncharacterized protein n=1 Tax=Petrolisthes cinctipes TaxID=88211 RepID=A0AAE1F4H2_PETCI|nr:hypothetical protein Pcinc_027723 [Petrolisthes cinctipes]